MFNTYVFSTNTKHTRHIKFNFKFNSLIKRAQVNFSLHVWTFFSDSSRLLFHAGMKSWLAVSSTYFAAFSRSIVFSCDSLVCTCTSYVHTRHTHGRSRRDDRRLHPTSSFVPLQVEIPAPSCVRFLFLSFSLHLCHLFLSPWRLSLPACPPGPSVRTCTVPLRWCEPFEYHLPSRQSELNRRPKRTLFRSTSRKSSVAARRGILGRTRKYFVNARARTRGERLFFSLSTRVRDFVRFIVHFHAIYANRTIFI